MKSGILRGNKRKTDDVAVRSRQHHPPVCHELTCRSISFILPQNRLKIILPSNSRPTSKGVGLCLPLMYPSRMRCWLKPAPFTKLVFCILSHHFPYRGFPVEMGVSDVAVRPLWVSLPFVLPNTEKTWRKGQTKWPPRPDEYSRRMHGRGKKKPRRGNRSYQ